MRTLDEFIPGDAERDMPQPMAADEPELRARGATVATTLDEQERLRRAWLFACALAEAIGIGFAASLITWVHVFAPHANWTAVYVAAGAVEGTALGALQARVLRRRVPSLNAAAFTAITALAAIAGWAGAALARSAAAAHGGMTQAPGLGVVLGMSVLGGAAAGVLFGAAQALVLGRYVKHSARFVVCNAGGWAAAMPVIFFGASVCALAWGLVAIAAVGIASGALAGTLLGSMTWLFVAKLQPK